MKKKPVILVVVFVILVIFINQVANFLLVQPGLARTMFHECGQGGYDCVILGASHGSYGLSPEEINEKTGYNTMNMCIGGEYLYDSYYVLKYAIKHNELKTVILDVDYQYLVNQHDESILFNNVYNAYPNNLDKLGYFAEKMAWEEYRGTFLRWTNYWQCYKYMGKTVKKKLSKEYKNYDASVVSMNQADTYVGNGFVSRSRSSAKSSTSCIEWDESKVSSEEIQNIKDIVSLCRKKNINIIFTTVCQDPDTINSQADKFKGANDYIKKLADELGVEYYNFNYLKQSVFERTTDDFYDKEGHMYGDTARRFSSIYGDVIRKSLDGSLNVTEYFE